MWWPGWPGRLLLKLSKNSLAPIGDGIFGLDMLPERKEEVVIFQAFFDFVISSLFQIWVFPKIVGFPQIVHLFIGFGTIICTIHFWGFPPIFGSTSISRL